MTLMLSLEVCLRLYRANKREQDPELDNLTNPQEVKHWIDPKIIPFGISSEPVLTLRPENHSRLGNIRQQSVREGGGEGRQLPDPTSHLCGEEQGGCQERSGQSVIYQMHYSLVI